MSTPHSRDPRHAALEQLVDAARSEPSPDLDWSRIEARLLQQVQGVTPPAHRKPQTLAWGALAIAAAAALWTLGTHTPRAPAAPTPLAVSTVAPSALNGEALALGSRVESDTREVSVEHPHHATWTLAPSSMAALAGRDERITVRLERGSVLSRVVPNPKPETFVVEAAGTRVAVHGTVFQVALEGSHVLVDVREGIVGVGPLGAPSVFFVKAGSRGEFAADGRSGSIDGQAVGDTAWLARDPLKAASVRNAGAAPSNKLPAPTASVELPAEPSINDIETGIARVVSDASDCFTRYAHSADGVELTARTALSLRVLASGEVADVDFQPPLSPEAEQCAATAISQVRFAPSKAGARVTRVLELKH